MKRLRLICLVLLGATLFTGCFFSRKSAKPKENTAIAAGLEVKFKQSFMEKRVADLTAAGVTPAAAQAQAEREFSEHYGFTSAAKK